MKLQSKHWCFISTKAGSNWLLGHDFNNCVRAELKNHSDTSLAVPRADSLDSCLWLGPDPRISTEGEAQVLHQIWRSDAVPSSSAGCISSAVTCEGQGGHRLWMWQHLSGANRGVEGRAGVYCCALCHALGRLCVSPWLRAMQKLAKNIVRRYSSIQQQYLHLYFWARHFSAQGSFLQPEGVFLCLFSALAADSKPRSPPEKPLHLVRRTGTTIYTLIWHKAN